MALCKSGFRFILHYILYIIYVICINVKLARKVGFTGAGSCSSINTVEVKQKLHEVCTDVGDGQEVNKHLIPEVGGT